jgi:hypothetical protein
MDRQLPLWAALSAGAVVFIGCGIFFAFQDLGTANDYTTIASFFLALLIAAGSLVSFLRSKQAPETARKVAEQNAASARSTLINLGQIGTLVNGDATYVEATIHQSPPDKKPSKGKGR